jgi:DNA-binding CsgD family transcriptional regulator
VTLVGRVEELALIDRFLDRAANCGDVLLLLGEPGVGKTALLRAAAEAATAAGTRLLRLSGVEFEADMPFAGLHQLLLPLHGDFEKLSSAQREALNVALGFGEGTVPDRLRVSNASLTLLRQAAAAHPLLVLVDDLPWLDRASADVLGFIARRLDGSRIGLLASSPTGVESFFERVGLPEHELQPLKHEAAIALLDVQFPTLPRRVRERVLAEAQGNPLALLELPITLSASQPPAAWSLPVVVPLSRRLQALFASRISELPKATRKLLLLAALDSTGELRVIRAARGQADGLTQLAPAERARLLYVDTSTHRLVFRHPVIRSAVVELATTDERRRAHRTLAELFADQPDRHAWHLAEATIGPDEHIAALLEQTARRILARGDVLGAVGTLTRASELSEHAADRARRLAEAGYLGAYVTGDLRNASELLAAARRVDPDLSGSLQDAVTASYVLMDLDGDVDTAHALLTGAIMSAAESDRLNRVALDEALYALLRVCYFGGRAELWQPLDAAITRLSPKAPAALYMATKTMSDPVRTAVPVLADLNDAIRYLRDEADPIQIVRIGLAALYVDRLSGCRDAFLHVIRDGRQGGAVASAIKVMFPLAWDDFWTGNWNEAQRLADEAVELCDSRGYRLLTWGANWLQAVLAGVRGDRDRTWALTEPMIHWAALRGLQTLHQHACHARTLAAITQGDYEEAYQQAIAISPAGSLAPHRPYAMWITMDLVEAAVRTGRHAEAAAHAAAIGASEIARISPRLALTSAASEAIAAPDETALELFEKALAIPGIDSWPFELARVELAFGERLRRTRATKQSRLHLTTAVQTFERLGAEPWALRAANELRASGEGRCPAAERDRDSLTSQEREIAELAAAGLSNKQIGQRLLLSHRTIGGHLHRTFPKLGITSRAALRDALATLPEKESDGSAVSSTRSQ